jgi:hypothetical protein
MGHCYYHALSSVKKWGGTAEDYLPLHQWFDESKAITADFRHRALRRRAGLSHFWRPGMADYFSPTVIQQPIPIADMTPLERLVLSLIFDAELDGETLYFHTACGPSERALRRVDGGKNDQPVAAKGSTSR